MTPEWTRKLQRDELDDVRDVRVRVSMTPEWTRKLQLYVQELYVFCDFVFQ